MDYRSCRTTIVGWMMLMLVGCQVGGLQSSECGTTVLTPVEMDQVTVGSASASIDIAARALAPAAQATTTASTVAVSSLNSNTSSSQAAAHATSARSAEVDGSSHTSVSSANGGAWIDATGMAAAAGGAGNTAQMSMQFSGMTTSRADLVFGTAAAGACCGPVVEAQVTAQAGAGGPYSMKIEDYSASDARGQAQSRVDIAVASSALPIVNPGQVMSITLARGSPSY